MALLRMVSDNMSLYLGTVCLYWEGGSHRVISWRIGWIGGTAGARHRVLKKALQNVDCRRCYIKMLYLYRGYNRCNVDCTTCYTNIDWG